MEPVSPSVEKTAFNCPHCSAFSNQVWMRAYGRRLQSESRTPDFSSPDHHPLLGRNVENVQHCKRLINVFAAICVHCENLSIWAYDKMIYPQLGNAPPANSDLPNDIRKDYDEASSILDLSPRGSAALIRLAIQKLCKHLGKSGKNLNQDIGGLVKEGLDPSVQKALDVVRVIGNNAVHPGQYDLNDNRQTAESLFSLLNLIANRMISEPKRVNEVYNRLPEGALQAIEKRDTEN